jgi:hypothetical protein
MRVGRCKDDGKARCQGQNMFRIVNSGVYGITRLCFLLSREACFDGCVHIVVVGVPPLKVVEL